MTLPNTLYFDYAATTPVDPRVLEVMLPYFTQIYGNPSNMTHVFGQEATIAVVRARQALARLLDCSPNEIIFTSGATESNNLVFKGLADCYCEKRREIITLPTEHKSVLCSAEALKSKGFQVTQLPVNAEGLVDLNRLEAAISERTALVSVMYVNNEIGVIQPIEAIAQLCAEKGVYFHCDAVQATGKIPFSLRRIPIDFLSISAHKMYGPKGIGCLFIRQKNPALAMQPCIEGGGQEFGLRSGTLNVPGIVGFGKAAALAWEEQPAEHQRMTGFFEQLTEAILGQLDGVILTGSKTMRYPGNIHFCVAGTDRQRLLKVLKRVALSTGSACSSGSSKLSHVLSALGITEDYGHGALRISLGRFTTPAEVDFLQNYLLEMIPAARRMAPSLLPF